MAKGGTSKEVESGVIYETPRSRELTVEAVARLAVEGRGTRVELLIEGEEAKRVREFASLLKATLSANGYLVGDDIDRAASEMLEGISGA